MSEGYGVYIDPMNFIKSKYGIEKMTHPYLEPKNKIAVVKDKDGKLRAVIGTEEDKILMNGIARIEVAKEVGPMEIMEGVLDVAEENKK